MNRKIYLKYDANSFSRSEKNKDTYNITFHLPLLPVSRLSEFFLLSLPSPLPICQWHSFPCLCLFLMLMWRSRVSQFNNSNQTVFLSLGLFLTCTQKNVRCIFRSRALRLRVFLSYWMWVCVQLSTVYALSASLFSFRKSSSALICGFRINWCAMAREM